MPVSGVSGTVSTSVYFVSMLLLLGILVPATKGAYGDATSRSASQLAGALADQIDALSPGMTSEISFSSFPGVSASVVLSGRSVTATVDGSSASAPVALELPTTTLTPDTRYVVSVRGGALVVA
jgi:hypothetical protein